MKFQRILAALDDSDLGMQVFERSIELAGLLRASLNLVHVVPIQQTMVAGAEPMMGGLSELGAYPVYTDPELWELQTQTQIEQSQQWLAKYHDQAQQAAIEVAVTCKVGDPGATICDLAQDWQADLIVIGRRGLSGLAEAFMGSVSNHVVHHAPCSVLVVQTHPSPHHE